MDTSSPEARDRLRQIIDDEIKAWEKSIHASKYRRNALVPISQLPSETLAAIFSFVSSSAYNREVGYLAWLHVTHVCRHWRETALNYPHLWSHINFTKLTTAGMAKVPARAKMAPLYLRATTTKWGDKKFDAFERQLKVHISHTHHLTLSGDLQTVLWRLVSPAPVLKSLTLSNLSSNIYSRDKFVIDDTLFNRTAPKLTSLTLKGCDIKCKSPLLKGLETLKMLRLSNEARPTLQDWLDALNEMTQLKTLILDFASPISSLGDSRISEPRRTVTLPSLTQFNITSSAEDCTLALSHLMLPALTSLYVYAECQHEEGNDVGLLIPHIARNAHGPQDTAPLQSLVIRGRRGLAETLAWTSPDAGVKDRNRIAMPLSARVVFAASLLGVRSYNKTETGIFDALLTQLPTDAISTLSIKGHTVLSKSFWRKNASNMAMLRRARLASTAFEAFRETLAEDSPPNGPRFPRLTKLVVVEFPLTALRTYHLHDMLNKRMEQGTPLEALDLRSCIAAERAIQLLSETVGDVQGPAKTLETGDPIFFNWKGGVDFFDKEEKRADSDCFYCGTGRDEDEGEGDEGGWDEDEDVWDDYDEDSDPYSDEL